MINCKDQQNKGLTTETIFQKLTNQEGFIDTTFMVSSSLNWVTYYWVLEALCDRLKNSHEIQKELTTAKTYLLK